jgi:hypothetical protein
LCSPPLATPAYDGYLALYQLVDVLPLLVIVVIFVVGTGEQAAPCPDPDRRGKAIWTNPPTFRPSRGRTHGLPRLNGIHSRTKENMMR